jgi:hypothetical protein
VPGSAADRLIGSALDRCRADDAGGVVVVTRFDCPDLPAFAVVRAAHVVYGRRVRAALGEHLLLSITRTDLRRRRIYSITAFARLADIYRMGQVRDHIDAAHLVARLGVTTSGGVFPWSGDWRTVLFAGPGGPSPLVDTPTEPAPPQAAESAAADG